MTAPAATPDAYFADRWATGDDPWAHGTRWYEARKYALTVAALPRRRYRCGFEPGCGAGFLTVDLAARTDRLIAVEREPRGAEVTAARLADRPEVEVRTGRIPDLWPDDTLDLLVLSEVLYYLDDAALDDVIGRAGAVVASGGDLVAVHYRGVVPEHARSGDQVHHRLGTALGPPLAHHLEAGFVLDAFGPPVASG